MIKDLYDGEEIGTFTDTYKDGERYVELGIFNNCLTINIPADKFHIIVREIAKADKILQLIEENEGRIAS
jgi:hypothetical protein